MYSVRTAQIDVTPVNDDQWTIAVVVPTYNRAVYLMRALESVARQSVPAQEVVVVDDGSTDETSKKVRRHFPNFRYIFQERKGVSAARNAGIMSVKSQWIAFLDSDDEWLPNKLATQINTLKNKQRYRICHTNEIWIRNGKRVNPLKKHQKHGGYIFRKCLPLCLISPSSVIIKKEVFDNVGCFDETLPACEDYDLWLRICATYPVLYIDKPLIRKYGGHDDQLSRVFFGMDRFRIYALEKIIRDNRLAFDDYLAASNVLLQKIEIYLTGARKRNRLAEVLNFEEKKRKYLTQRKVYLNR